MNTNNYGSREACQRLVDVGIVLETEAHWIKYGPEWELKFRQGVDAEYGIPAPSMAEVLRVLPIGATIEKAGNCYHAFVVIEGGYGRIIRANPADTLIDLLIWVRKEGGENERNMS